MLPTSGGETVRDSYSCKPVRYGFSGYILRFYAFEVVAISRKSVSILKGWPRLLLAFNSNTSKAQSCSVDVIVISALWGGAVYSFRKQILKGWPCLPVSVPETLLSRAIVSDTMRLSFKPEMTSYGDISNIASFSESNYKLVNFFATRVCKPGFRVWKTPKPGSGLNSRVLTRVPTAYSGL